MFTWIIGPDSEKMSMYTTLLQQTQSLCVNDKAVHFRELMRIISQSERSHMNLHITSQSVFGISDQIRCLADRIILVGNLPMKDIRWLWNHLNHQVGLMTLKMLSWQAIGCDVIAIIDIVTQVCCLEFISSPNMMFHRCRL